MLRRRPRFIGGPGAEGMTASCESGSLASGHQLDHHLTGNRISDAKPAAEVFKRVAEGIERRDHMRARCRHRLHAVPLAYETIGSLAGLDDSYPAHSRPLQRCREDFEYKKGELSSRWKGGLSDGDPVRMGGRNLEVIGHNPENGKVVLADTDMVDSDQLKEDAYTQYKKHISGAWKKQREPSPKEWECAGPLSDSQSAEVKEQAWRDSVEELQNAWRK